MRTIFFARGPSIKKGALLPTFQNIEYMNLWIDLLGLKNDVPNNGTLGTMDAVLVSKPERRRETGTTITECPLSFQLPAALNCGECNKKELIKVRVNLLEETFSTLTGESE
uniref:Uncharacterized protein n=1 Tax=Heterorhabditis bacteriophora TaxID=37862 RepID=A0A1I7XLU5_HETBA